MTKETTRQHDNSTTRPGPAQQDHGTTKERGRREPPWDTFQGGSPWNEKQGEVALRGELDSLDRLLLERGRSRKDIVVSFKPSQFDPAKAAVKGQRRRFTGAPEEILSDIRTYGALGVDVLIFDMRGPSPAAVLERMEWLAQEVITKDHGTMGPA